VISAARRTALAGAAIALVLAPIAGCSDDTTDSDTSSTATSTATSTESATPAVCSDLDAVKASLQALVDTNVAQEGTNTLKERFASLQSDLETLWSSGQAEAAPETNAVKEATAQLKDVLAGIKDSPTAANLAQLKPALQAVQTSTEDLVSSLGSTC
jgi:cell fate (sporulation/competence/biofilm development) regulator YlbF (YheA/YmcA/DUF963 family)